MKDLVFITAYCPTDEQINALERCINSVIDSNHHVALISHTHIPIHIQKKCNYYFYDYFNDISDDYNFIGYNSFSFDGYSIQSKFFNKSFYGFSIYRMFSIASQLAINFGYKNIHHIEYDCEFFDKNLITEHSNLLNEYDSIIYTDNGKEDGFLLGSFKSFKVESLPEQFKNYNKDFIVKEMKSIEPKHLEFLTKKLFINHGKVLFKNKSELNGDRFKNGEKFYSRNLHYTLYYDDNDKTLNIFYNSIKKETENITVIINKEKVVNVLSKPNHWTIKKLGVFDEINDIRIDNSEKILYQKSFDLEMRNTFKDTSYISKK